MFQDPTGGNREAVLILFDSSKFLSEKSMDKFLQWAMYFDPKNSHFLTYTVATDVNGDIVFLSPASTSNTPRGT